MNTEIAQVFDKASIKAGGDAALARALGHSRAYMSRIRSGDKPVPTELAVRLADLAGVPREVAVIAAAEARAETEAERETWARLRRLVAAACLLVVVLGGVVPAPAFAGKPSNSGPLSESARNIHYATIKKRERKRARDLMVALRVWVKSALISLAGGLPRGFAPHPRISGGSRRQRAHEGV